MEQRGYDYHDQMKASGPGATFTEVTARPSPASAFNHASARLQESLEGLAMLAGALEERLTAALSGGEPHAQQDTPEPPGSSSVVGFVWNAANEADATAERIRRILDRIELG